MKDNILTHKILPVLSIFILCFFSICVTSVNAAHFSNIQCGCCSYVSNLNLSDTYPDLNIDLTGSMWHIHDYVVIEDNGVYRLFGYNTSSSPTDGYFYLDNGSINYNYFRAIDSWYYDTDSDSWIYNSAIFEPYTVPEGAKIISSSVDIYTDINKSDVFFQLTPQGITQTLVEETTKTQIMEQMKAMIVGFLKYLIVLVISLIAFWKGWQFLSTQLKKA